MVLFITQGVQPTKAIPDPGKLLSSNMKISKRGCTVPSESRPMKFSVFSTSCQGVVRKMRSLKQVSGRPWPLWCQKCRKLSRKLQYYRRHLRDGMKSDKERLSEFRRLVAERRTKLELDKVAVQESFFPADPNQYITLDKDVSDELLSLIKELVEFEKSHPENAAINHAKEIGAFQLIVEQLRIHMSDVAGKKRRYSPGYNMLLY